MIVKVDLKLRIQWFHLTAYKTKIMRHWGLVNWKSSAEITKNKAQSEREGMKEVQGMGLECTDLIIVPERASKEWGRGNIWRDRARNFLKLMK